MDGSVNPVNSLRDEAHEETSHHVRKSKESVKIPTEDIDDIVSVTDLKITSLI